MPYRIDKGTNELVIDGWEKGIAQSPYLGIANIRNLNTSYMAGAAYVNYRRQACTLGNEVWFAGVHSVNVSDNRGWNFTSASAPTMGNPLYKAVSPSGLIYVLDSIGSIFKQSAVNSSTFNLILGGTGRITNGSAGLAWWNSYLVVFGNGLMEFCGDGTGDAGITASNWNISNGSGAQSRVTTISAQTSPSQITKAKAFMNIYVNDPVQFTTTGTLPAPLALSTTYYIQSIAANILQVSATAGGSAITITTTGSGVHTMTDLVNPSPVGNVSGMTLQVSSGDVPPAASSATIVTYTDVRGNTVTGEWQGASGQYNIVSALTGDQFLGTFTRGSSTVGFLIPTVLDEGQAFSVQVLNPSATSYKTWVSKVDGNLYFANGRFLGRVLAENSTTVFNPSSEGTYVVDYAATSIIQPNDSIVDIVDLKSIMVIAGNRDVYTWDYVSAESSSPTPIGEQIARIINLLNNIYVLAGQKGNVYVSNGYSAQLLYRLVDYITGVIDPVWSFGDIMSHRSKLYFQASAANTSGTNLIAGVFSMLVSPGLLGEQAQGLSMEAQNSYGLIPSAGSATTGCLIDAEPSSSGQDSYYSAWSNGASTGGIDYNDTSLWQNYEPLIETDLVPIGSILNKQTLGQAQFKLDRPMAAGDSIRLAARTNLTDPYTTIGTSTTAQLSEYFPSNLAESQWIQFEISYKAASSGSSFLPLREMRIQLQ